MADIIDSSSKNGALLMREFKKLVELTNNNFNNNFLSPLTITLGDEFQGISKDLITALKVIFFIEERLIRANSQIKFRYVINYGNIDTPINPNIAHEMYGSGLTKARNHLERLKKSAKKVFIDGIDKKKAKELNLSFAIYFSLVDNWRRKDDAIIDSFLRLEDYKLVANELNKDISTTWRKKKTLKISTYLATKELIEIIAE